MSGAPFGTSGTERRTLVYGYVITALLVGVINAINVVTIEHDHGRDSLIGAAIDEGSSWVTLLAFYWIPWLAWRFAPPGVRPRWKLLAHLPAALVFSLAHVAGFVLLRRLAFAALGADYRFGNFATQFLYEFRKDALGYALFVSFFAFIAHLLRQQAAPAVPAMPATYDIRDGTRILRVRFADILAVSSAGNYVEFVLRDGRKPLMRMPLGSLESELAPQGFLRTHRSWLVNATHVTALVPEGSGDYTLELDGIAVPLSRRFPEALARLRNLSA